MRKAREIWQQIVRQYECSGLTQEGFALERGMPLSTLQYWIYRVRREDAKGARLLPVRVVALSAPLARRDDDGGLIEAELPDGLRLRFGGGTPSATVVEVLGQLRRC